MKKFQVLAGIASAVAIASGIALGDAAPAFSCFENQSGAALSGSGTTLLGSGGSDRVNPWKSYKTAAFGFLGLAGILGGGAAYMSYRAGQRASAACAAMSDNFEVFEEPIADAGVTEPADAVAGVREHPEAPGGELDLPGSQVGGVSAESAIEEGQSAIVK